MKLAQLLVLALVLAASLLSVERAQAAMSLESLDARGITFGANGTSPTTERMRITTSGNVGVGTQSPTATLQVSGTFTVSNSAQTTTPSLFVSTLGYLGFGTSAPAQFFDISGSVGNVQVTSDGAHLFFTRPNINYIQTTGAGSSLNFSVNGGGDLGPIMVLNAANTVSVTSAMQIGSANALNCTTGISGSIRYSITSSTLEYCQGTAWTSLGPSATAVPAFSVILSGNQTVSAGVGTKIAFNTKTFDTYTNFNTTTNRFTPTIAGKYLITLSVYCPSIPNTGTCGSYIYKNGSPASYSKVDNNTGSARTMTSGNTTVLLDMNGSTDYVEGYGFTDGTVFDASYTKFYGTLIASGNGLAGGGAATPAGSTADIQFNNAGALAADSGNFTYSSGLLKVPTISATTVSGTNHYGQYASLTTIFNSGSFSGNTIAANSVSSTLISATNISGTVVQVGAGGLCAAGTSGAIRYNNTSNTIDYCSGSAWLSLGPSATQPVSFLAHKNGTAQTVTTSTDTKLTFSTKAFDTNNNFSTGTSRFTPTIPGKYLVHLQLRCTGVTTYCWAEIWKNGADIAQNAIPGSGNIHVAVTQVIDMNGTTDYLEAYGNDGGGTSIDGGSINTFFESVLLGPQAGSGGSGTPAGTTADIQYNNSGALAADTGVFTYTTGAAGGISVTRVSSTYASLTTVFNGGSFSGNTITANSVSSSVVSASTISGTDVQIGAGGACGATLAGKIRYNSASNTLQICPSGGVWTSLSSSTTAGSGVTGGTANFGAIFSGPTTLVTDSAIYVDTTNHRLGVGTNAPGYALDVNGYVGAVNFYQTSDRRLKTNITPIADGLDIIKRLKPVTFDWKKDHRPSAGLIAQEVEPILPHAIVSTTEGTYSLDYIQTVPYLIRSVQQLQAANDNLEREVSELRKQLRANGRGQ